MGKNKKRALTAYHYVVKRLEKLCNEQKKIIKRQDEKIKELTEENLNLKIRAGELEKMIFKGKKEEEDDDDDDEEEEDDDEENEADDSDRSQEAKKKKRSKESYKRKPVKEEDIDDDIDCKCENCPHCGTKVIPKDKPSWSRAIEDIKWFFEFVPTLIIRYRIYESWCPKCRRMIHADPPGTFSGQKIGNNIRVFILYAIHILKLPESKIIEICKTMFKFEIGEGEITKIREQAGLKGRITYNELLEYIRKTKSSNMDETSWQIGKEKGYMWNWVAEKAEKPTIILKIDKSRGKRVAEDLVGNYAGFLGTDFYAAYKNLVKNHAGCWAHIIKDAKNLYQNKNLPKKYKPELKNFYNGLQEFYKRILLIRETFKDDIEKRKEQRDILKKELLEFTVINETDPPIKKFKNLKLRIEEYIKELFLCVVRLEIDPTNNAAERGFRSEVIHRKISFGNKTEKGADLYSLHASVIQTLKMRDPDNILENIRQTYFA